jgi:YidC/Oxa1 family membrane protein insertase
VELYESEGYDHLAPFKGMLGLFIQIPILIALFTVIGDMSALRGAPFLWIEDLSLSDRLFSLGITLPFFGGYFNLLPWLMAIVTILSTWQASRGSKERTPVFSLFGMALLFFIFFYSFPAALVLYWLSSNLFQLIQQIFAKGAVSEKTSA